MFQIDRYVQVQLFVTGESSFHEHTTFGKHVQVLTGAESGLTDLYHSDQTLWHF